MAELSDLTSALGAFKALIPTHELVEFEIAMTGVSLALGKGSHDFQNLSKAAENLKNTTAASRMEFTKMMEVYSASAVKGTVSADSFQKMHQALARINPFGATQAMGALKEYPLLMDSIAKSVDSTTGKVTDLKAAQELYVTLLAKGDLANANNIAGMINGTAAASGTAVAYKKLASNQSDLSISSANAVMSLRPMQHILQLLDSSIGTLIVRGVALKGLWAIAGPAIKNVLGVGIPAAGAAATGAAGVGAKGMSLGVQQVFVVNWPASMGGSGGSGGGPTSGTHTQPATKSKVKPSGTRMSRRLAKGGAGRAAASKAGALALGAKSLPLLGALLGGVESFMDEKDSGGSTGAAVTRGATTAGGAWGGAAAGAAIGSLAGPIGTAVGGVIGGILGGMGGDSIGKLLTKGNANTEGILDETRNSETPEVIATKSILAIRKNVDSSDARFTGPGGQMKALADFLQSKMSLSESMVAKGLIGPQAQYSIAKEQVALKEKQIADVTKKHVAEIAAIKADPTKGKMDIDAANQLYGAKINALKLEQLNQMGTVRRSYMEQMGGGAMGLPTGVYTDRNVLSERNLRGDHYVDVTGLHGFTKTDAKSIQDRKSTTPFRKSMSDFRPLEADILNSSGIGPSRPPAGPKPRAPVSHPGLPAPGNPTAKTDVDKFINAENKNTDRVVAAIKGWQSEVTA